MRRGGGVEHESDPTCGFWKPALDWRQHMDPSRTRWRGAEMEQLREALPICVAV